MSKAIITFEDSEDGGTTCKITFDPPMKTGDDLQTQAQICAMNLVTMFAEEFGGVADEDEE